MVTRQEPTAGRRFLSHHRFNEPATREGLKTLQRKTSSLQSDLWPLDEVIDEDEVLRLAFYKNDDGCPGLAKNQSRYTFWRIPRPGRTLSIAPPPKHRMIAARGAWGGL